MLNIRSMFNIPNARASRGAANLAGLTEGITETLSGNSSRLYFYGLFG
jgi:hypothetical protein